MTNLLLKEQNALSNRIIHISHVLGKVDIDPAKVDIQPQQVDIEQLIKEKLPTATTKTKAHIAKLYTVYKTTPYFGRTDVALLLGIKPAMASRLLKLLTNHLIEPVTGKGKYCFVQF